MTSPPGTETDTENVNPVTRNQTDIGKLTQRTELKAETCVIVGRVGNRPSSRDADKLAVLQA